MTKCAKHQPECSECGEPSEVLFKGWAHNSDTWFFTQCYACEAYLCEKCAERVSDDGATVCLCCLSHPSCQDEQSTRAYIVAMGNPLGLLAQDYLNFTPTGAN